MNKIIRSFNKRIDRLESTNSLSHKGKIIHFKPSNVTLALDYIKFKLDYLRKVNGNSDVAQNRYYKTLNKDLTYLQNVLYWFNKWNLNELTKENIEEVFSKLEDNTLKSVTGQNLLDSTKDDYYSKVLKNGFFKHIKKSELAREVIIRKFIESKDVRFMEYDIVVQLSNALRYADHKLLVWLLFDTGVEIDAVLHLKKNDFSIQKSEELEDYYMLHVRAEISKKSRSPRDIFIYHQQTNDLLKEVLQNLQDDENLFKFEWRNAYKIIHETSKKFNLKLKTPDDYITPKDFRSSCATYFLKEGWTLDQVKARLGHKPSSTVIDRYVNYLGLDQQRQKKQKEEIDSKNYKEKYNKISERNRKLEEDVKRMDKDLELLKKFLTSNPEIKDLIDKAKP